MSSKRASRLEEQVISESEVAQEKPQSRQASKQASKPASKPPSVERKPEVKRKTPELIPVRASIAQEEQGQQKEVQRFVVAPSHSTSVSTKTAQRKIVPIV